MTLAIILLAIAVIIITAPSSWPFSPSTCAFILALIALLIVCGAWAGIR